MHYMLIERRELESMRSSQVGKVKVSDLLRAFRARHQRRQVIVDSLCMTLNRKFFQQFPGFVHGNVEDFLVGADTKKSNLSQRT
jgi:hypothetical protein